MIFPSRDPERRVVPRWRSLSDFVDGKGLEHIASSKFPVNETEVALTKAEEAWRNGQSPISAIELIAASITANKNTPLIDNAQAYLEKERIPLFSLKGNSSLIFTHNQEEGSQDEFPYYSVLLIRDLRRSLRESPNDPLKWLRLAREYTLTGQAHSKAAIRAVHTAVALAPDDRYILRCATRFFLHIDSPEESIWLLLRSKRTKTDPWLASALVSCREIANKPQRGIKSYNALASNKNWSDRARTELSSMLGSLAIDTGNVRQGKKHFKEALLDPNENVLAQTIWTQESRNVALTSKPFELKTVEKSFEASALEFKREKAWKPMMDMCRKWQLDEPYSTRPASMGSHIALTLRENVAEARDLLMLAYKANPNDTMLKNNLAFAHAISGDLDSAKNIFGSISGSSYKKDSPDGMVFNATQGLIHFRNGDLESGRYCYKQSIDFFESNSYVEQALNCKGQYAMEEIRSGNFLAGVALQSEISNSDKRKAKSSKQSNEIEELIKRVGLLLEASKER